jgi:hypothetical protein
MASHTLTSDLVTLDRRDPLARALFLVSLIVGLSSLWFGVVIALSLSKFPALAYEHHWRAAWAAAFLATGLCHVGLLARWLAGHPSPALARVHRVTACVALPFAGLGVLSVASDGDGYLIAGCCAGGAALSLICSRVGIWRTSGVSR